MSSTCIHLYNAFQTEFNKITYSLDGPEDVLTLFSIDDSGVIRALDSAAADAINLGSETKYKVNWSFVLFVACSKNWQVTQWSVSI